MENPLLRSLMGKRKEELVFKESAAETTTDKPVVLNIIAFISPLPMVIHAATEQNGVRNIFAASDCKYQCNKTWVLLEENR